MPRFTLHRQKDPPTSAGHVAMREPEASTNEVPEGLRQDPRVTIMDEMPRLLLIECPEEAAAEWLARMPGWKLQQEHRARIPDPRPKLKKPSTD